MHSSKPYLIKPTSMGPRNTQTDIKDMDGVLELGVASELSPSGECQGSGPDCAVFIIHLCSCDVIQGIDYALGHSNPQKESASELRVGAAMLVRGIQPSSSDTVHSNRRSVE